MSNRHNTEKSSTCPNQPHSQEMELSTIYSKNSFEQYPPNIPIQFTPDPSYMSSPDIPHQDSSSNEELQGVSTEEPLYLIPKTEVN